MLAELRHFPFFCWGQNIVSNSLSRKEMLEAALKLDPLNKASNANCHESDAKTPLRLIGAGQWISLCWGIAMAHCENLRYSTSIMEPDGSISGSSFVFPS